MKQEEKGRLYSERTFTNFGSERKVVDSNQSFEVQKGHTISTQERARNFKEKIAVFDVQSDQNRVKYESVRKLRKGGGARVASLASFLVFWNSCSYG